MRGIESHRKLLNQQQTELRRVMMSFDQHDKAIRLFLTQHTLLHSAKMARSEPWSYEDEVLNDMTEVMIRRIPGNEDHSVAWCIWHIARIEDVAMNLLVSGSPQILYRENWAERMNAPVHHTGNAMSKEDVAQLSATIDLEGLRAYRVAVGRRTREIVPELEAEALKQNVDTVRLQRVRDEEAVVEAARGIVEYWSRRTIAGLLLMPATRHSLVHLNEAIRLKSRRQ